MYQIDLEIVFSLGDVIDKVKPFDCVYLEKRDRFNVVKKKKKKMASSLAVSNGAICAVLLLHRCHGFILRL